MGCDGFIKDKHKPVLVEIHCYICSRVVGHDPLTDHIDCWEIGPDGEDYLRVNVEIGNYECR